jgi:hypothetical protein
MSKPYGVDLASRHEQAGWAVYLPAISSFYAEQLSKIDNDPVNFLSPNRMPVGFEKGHKGLNYLDKENGYYYYKWGLYSAGHAYLDLSKSVNLEKMVQGRNRGETTVIGDSGGFQISTGVLKLDWATVMTPKSDPLRKQILEWLEETADWSMTLDVPALAAEPPLSAKTGLTKFQDTLDVSVYNLDYFMKNRRPGKTKFLNVLSGSRPENSKIWYDTVKAFSDPKVVKELGYDPACTLEGYAFAGINMKHMPTVLSRLVDLIEDGLIEGKDWMHFLGIGKLDWACYLTSIQRQLRKHYNPNLTISFDAASPYVTVAYGKCYTYNSFQPKRWTYAIDKAIDDKELKGSTLQMPFQSPIADRLKIGDLCYLGPNDANKNGKIAKTSWDTFSYILYMAHNVYTHIQAVQEANRITDIERARLNMHYRDWSKQKPSAKAGQLSSFVPAAILFFDSFVEELFDPATKNRRQLIEDNRSFLESISFGGTDATAFDSLFEMEEPEVEAEMLADLNDEKLLELEKAAKE